MDKRESTKKTTRRLNTSKKQTVRRTARTTHGGRGSWRVQTERARKRVSENEIKTNFQRRTERMRGS